MASPTEKNPARRRDAEENRARIVAAAREVYASAGFDAPFDAIARQAGVGRATLYRNFPDRFALGAAIVEQHTETHALVPALFRGPGAPDLRTLVRRVTRLLTAPLRRARAAGLVRDDLTLADVIDVLAMISAVVTGDASGRSRARRVARALELLMHGLVPREPAGSPPPRR